LDNNLQYIKNAIWKIKSSNKFKDYIDFIRFPFYRNLEIDTKIKFEFPLTVFIGQNGCGKSSCLHALYGAPKNYTPYDFWFDTKVDPISYYNDQRKRHSFWYSFNDSENKRKEVIKARIKRGNNPNYWETSRPLAWAGMRTRKKKNERDTPIKKNVVYIDFRAELSAFDKFFYFGSVKGIVSKNKQEFIQKKAVHLKKVLSGETEVIYTKAGPANKNVRRLNQAELKWISFILGKDYLSGIYLEHSFFRNEGYSVVFETSHAKYSEAFAGSGEVAVVRLVLKVLDASSYSLILLDEPEVSLHPGAQARLRIFLLEQIKDKKHQVVLTSHSPSIIKDLPKEAIKVFYQNPSSGRFLVKENISAEEAFFHIEFPVDNRKNIIVEDVLAKEIIEGVLSKIGEETKNLFNVKYNPGGVSVIKREFATVFCREENVKDFIFFDGDQKPVNPHFDWRNFPTTSLTVNFLKTKVREQTKEDIKFSVDSDGSGGSQKQQMELLKRYLDYYLNNVYYLPQQVPEEIIWNDETGRKLIEVLVPEKDKVQDYLDRLNNTKGIKQKFALVSEALLGDSSSSNIATVHKQFLQNWLKKDNEDQLKIIEMIGQVINA
jgi:predicted ATPase